MLKRFERENPEPYAMVSSSASREISRFPYSARSCPTTSRLILSPTLQYVTSMAALKTRATWLRESSISERMSPQRAGSMASGGSPAGTVRLALVSADFLLPIAIPP
jgi:hypothetical protein